MIMMMILFIAIVAFSNMVVDVQAQLGEQCTNSQTRFRGPDTSSSCLNWNEQKTYEYPGDFNILNKVDIYTCPESKKRIIVSNGIPDHKVSLWNTNNIPCEVNWIVSIPLIPTFIPNMSERQEIPLGGMIAMAKNGVPAYGPKEAEGTNVEIATQLRAFFWYGHATGNDVWHFHNPHMGHEETVSEDTILGYSMDGYPIMGPLPLNSDAESLLDDCNGMDPGDGYRYHVRRSSEVDENKEYCKDQGNSPANQWNYILGCYAGSVEDSTVERNPGNFELPDDCVIESERPPTSEPSPSPTQSPTESPTSRPTLPPTMAPTRNPTSGPTSRPTTSNPTNSPTLPQPEECADCQSFLSKYDNADDSKAAKKECKKISSDKVVQKACKKVVKDVLKKGKDEVGSCKAYGWCF